MALNDFFGMKRIPVAITFGKEDGEKLTVTDPAALLYIKDDDSTQCSITYVLTSVVSQYFVHSGCGEYLKSEKGTKEVIQFKGRNAQRGFEVSGSFELEARDEEEGGGLGVIMNAMLSDGGGTDTDPGTIRGGPSQPPP